jgi:hypothetical protein
MLNPTKNEKRTIHDSTGGYCHLCHAKVCWKNYGKHGSRGAWEVDHSVARANGGTDLMPNLRPACTSCNREKQAMTTPAYRALHDVTGFPPSRAVRRADAAQASRCIRARPTRPIRSRPDADTTVGGSCLRGTRDSFGTRSAARRSP